MASEITETGPVRWKGIRNTDLYNNLSTLSENGDDRATSLLSSLSLGKSRPFSTGDEPAGYFTPQEYAEKTPYATLGKSQYDEPYIMGSNPEDVGEIRYENQPWYDVLANGIGKMLGTAATTFASSLIGLPYGLFQVAKQGDPSAIWNNDVTQGLASVDKWLEDNMTNYKSQKQQESPWYNPSNLFSMNFIADDIIKNAGFTLGAAASMAVGTGTAGLLSKSLNFVNSLNKNKGIKMAGAALGALFSATGEGMIEARQGVEERNKLELQKLNDSLATERKSLEDEFNFALEEYNATKGQTLVTDREGRMYDPAFLVYEDKMKTLEQKRNDLQQRYEAGKAQIEESGEAIGNKILFGNQVLLTAGNLIQFGKGMMKSFDSARHAAETTTKATKPFLVGAKRVGKNIKDGYKVTGTKLGMTVAATKVILTEGSEEMNQQWIQSSSAAAHNEEDVNDYWKATLDPDAYRETTSGLYSLGKVLSKGFSESWGDKNQWEQFFIGGLTGMTGTYMPTKIFNTDKTKAWYDLRRWGEWSGGAVNAISDYRDELRKYKENIDDVNKILASQEFPSRIKSMIGHTYYEKEKELAVENGDKKAYKDADDKQNIHDVQAFLRAGKLDDLRAIYSEMAKDLSDEDVESIIKSTTREISAEEDKKNFDSSMDAAITEKQDKVRSIYDEVDRLRTGLLGSAPDAYDVNRDYVTKRSSELLGQAEQLEESIAELEKAKQDYIGKKKYVGPYIDEQGNKVIPNDKIREITKHNAEELNRKLDSYLNSIAVVNKMSEGNLTKDQEDNLAYLHNIYAEKDARFKKVMSNVRKSLPTKFLIKTNETPEQLAKSYASSDLAFSKNENTPDGYVEVDTSAINDETFAPFFADVVLWGQNIQPVMTKEEIAEELTAREEDKKYTTEEQEKRRKEREAKLAALAAKRQKESEADRKEQQDKNIGLIKKALVEGMMDGSSMSMFDALNSDKLANLFNDINDALELRNEASEFYDTFDKYMKNPSLIDKAAEKEAKKTEEKQANNNADKSSLSDIMSMDDALIGGIIGDGKKGKNNSEKKATAALGIKNGKKKAEEELNKLVIDGKITEEAAADAMALLDSQVDSLVEGYDDSADFGLKDIAGMITDTETEIMLDPLSLASDTDAEEDINALADRMDAARAAIDMISGSVADELGKIEKNIDAGFIGANLEETDKTEAGGEALRKASSKEAEDNTPADPPVPKGDRKTEKTKPVTVRNTSRKVAAPSRETSSGEDSSLTDDMNKGTNQETPAVVRNRNWHPWMSSTSEVGQRTNEPYEPAPGEANAEFKKKRYDVIRKKLEDSGAFAARKAGKITEGMKVHFAVFKDVNDAADDFVIFITDEEGNIIGDMPSNDPRLATSKRDVSMDDIYTAIKEVWDKSTEEEQEKGVYIALPSKVDFVLTGKVKYQRDRQTVQKLVEGSGVAPLFAINTAAGLAQPNVEGVRTPLTGNVGQPYVLIQTPEVNKDSQKPKYFCVPIRTMTVGQAVAANTTFAQVLREVLEKLKAPNGNEFEAKRALEALLAVGNIHINIGNNSGVENPGISITTFDRVHGTEQKMPHVIYSGTRSTMDIDAVISALSDIYINVSKSHINNNERGKDVPLTLNGVPVDYNAMIAEVAHTNAAEPQTVNNWFTIRPLVKNADGKFEMVEQEDKLPEWDTLTSDAPVAITPNHRKDVKWSINPKTYDVYNENGILIDKAGNGITKQDIDEAKIQKALFFGMRNLRDMNRPYACVVDNKTYIFDPKKRTFRTYKQLETKKYKYKNSQEVKKTLENGSVAEDEKADVIQAFLDDAAAMSYEEDTALPVSGAGEQVDHTTETVAKLQSMREESSHYHLVRWDEKEKKYVRDDENGEYYQDDRDGSISARVSAAVDAEEDIVAANKKAGFTGKSPILVPASGAGNAVDTFVRRFFTDYVVRFADLDLNKAEDLDRARNIAKELYAEINTPNINLADAINLAIELAKFKQEKLGNDWQVDATGIKVNGQVSFDGKNFVNVTGTIDLLVYNPKKGEYMIVDMKTHISPLLDKEGKLQETDRNLAKWEHWVSQQTLYKKFLESKYGIKVKSLRIMPFSVKYTVPNARNKASYTVENGVLKNNGVVEDVHPVFDGKFLAITPRQDVKYVTAQLPEEIKRLLPGKNSAIATGKEYKKLPIKKQLNNLLDKVPEGMSLKDFIKEELKDNVDVNNLIDILESNVGSAEPVLMTAASQSLVLQAIDSKALSKAAIAEKGKKQGLPLEIPAGEEENTMKEEELDDDARDIFEELAPQYQKILRENGALMYQFAQQVKNADDINDIEKFISTQSSKSTIRHKKAINASYKKLDLKKEIEWLKKNLPQLSDNKHLRLVEGLVRCSDGTDDFGQLMGSVITIGTDAEKGTVYHEAFHAVVQLLLTDEEINTLFEEARKKYGDLPAVALEERLADDFEAYTQGLEIEGNKIVRFFKELWKAIKALFGNTSYIETLYRNINTGVYSGSEFKDNRQNAFMNIAEMDRVASRNFEYLTDEERERLADASIEATLFDQLSKEEQEYLIHCIV